MERPSNPNRGLEHIRGYADLAARPVDPAPQIKPYDEAEYMEEARKLGYSLAESKNRAFGIPVIGLTRQDHSRWIDLERIHSEGIEPIHSIQREKLAEVDRSGSDNWLEVAHYHATDLGSELMARRNIRQRLGFARKYGVEGRMGPYLQLLEFYEGLVTSIRIGDVTLQDFIDPQDKTLASRYRFLTQARLIIDRNLYDEILEDNQEFPKNAYPNIVKGILWVLPNKIGALLTLNPGTFEETYRDARHPLNNIGVAAAKLISGVQETRERIFSLILDPNSRNFSALKQMVSEYLASDDGQVVTNALNLLGLHQIGNVRQLYRRAKSNADRGIEREFFSLLRDRVVSYAKEVSLLNAMPDEGDMDLIADLENPLDGIPVPTFQDLGQLVSGVFQRSSQTSYTIDPSAIDWPVSVPKSVSVQFDGNRPKKFDVVLTYVTDDGEESTEVAYSLDAAKAIMDWGYLADPMSPEDDKISNFRSMLLIATQSILRNIQKQADEKYQERIAKPSAQTPQETRSKRQRFEDPVYALRKEMRVEQQRNVGRLQLDIPINAVTEVAKIRNEVVVPTGAELDKLLRALSEEDRQIVKEKLDEFNQFGTGGELTKKEKLGPDGRERWTLRIACSVPKGVRVLLAPEEFSRGLRKFETIDARYRKDVYPKNKL